jgi:hypothetical protein
MTEEKNFFVGLVDFAFQQLLLRRLVKVLYVIAILAGGVGLVTFVVLQMQISPSVGLIALGEGIVSYFVWILIVRLVLELSLVILRIAEGIERATRGGS